MPYPTSRQTIASQHVFRLGVGGLCAATVSFALACWAYPTTSLVDGTSSGNTLLFYLFLGTCGLSQLAVLVAVVAWGVRLGVDWSGMADTTTRMADAATTATTARTPSTRPATGPLGAIEPTPSRSSSRPGDLAGIEPLGQVADHNDPR